MLKNRKKYVIALGYFDSVHIGHRKVIERAKEQAEKLNAELLVFTFKGNLKGKILGVNEKSVYGIKEREELIKATGVKNIYKAPVSEKFLGLNRKEFLDKINFEKKIVGYVCGANYRFGKNAQGDVEYLKEYAKEKGQEVNICEYVEYDGEKVSTTRIKEKLESGEIEKANAMLQEKYFVCGKVIKDRKVGKKIGIPTANIEIESEKQEIKDGVYGGSVEIGGKEYRAVINKGARPTFNEESKKIEVHIIGYNKDIYGKRIKVKFERRIRDIEKFSDTEKLKERIEEDIKKVLGEGL